MKRRTPSISVLMLATEYPAYFGGLGTHLYELANGLAAQGVQVEIWVPGAFTRKADNHSLITIRKFRERTKYRESHSQRIKRHEKEVSLYARRSPKVMERFDIIHCHDWFLYEAARAIADRLDIPCVATLHLLSEPCLRWVGQTPHRAEKRGEKRLCEGADLVIAVSRWVAKLVTQYHRVPTKRLSIISNGCDLHFEAPTSAQRQELRKGLSPHGGPIVLYAGRFVQQKGVLELLQSARDVLRINKNVDYVFVGAMTDPSVTPKIERFLKRHPDLKPHLHFLGHLGRELVIALLHASDLAVVPSAFEPFGFAALEASAAGLPVIATRTGGLMDIITAKTGVLVPLGPGGKVSVDALTRAQIRLIENPRVARQLGSAGKKRARQFSREKMATETRLAYLKLLARVAGSMR